MPEKLTLKVAEAFPKDVGKGIARMDPAHMDKIGAVAGDVVEIVGGRTTVARLMPSPPSFRGGRTIQIDGIIRRNAQAAVDEKVKVTRTFASPAVSIMISAPSSSKRDLKYLGRWLEGLPLVKDDLVRVSYFGTRYQEYLAAGTSPAGAVILGPRTKISFSDAEPRARPGNELSYEDVGGLGKEIRKVREMVELPLKHPELFENAGIDPPRGILLHGPPGTGKTLIARAVASETSAHFMHVNGPEIMNKFYGESEARLRDVFAEAGDRAPSILFIDEIDVIAPKREKIAGDVEKRVVGQLLALMDGLKSRGQVVVIGATNIPGALDPALRRPGRFDREISISVPDKNGRQEILSVHTRGMPLADDVNVEQLADVTHGYVGADLAALCREAAMSAIRKIMPETDSGQISPEIIYEMKITMDDFRAALADIVPSTTREVFVEVPEVTWEDIGGLEAIKLELKKAVEWPLKYAKLFSYARTEPPKGILLHGPPGTGKTLLAKAVASESRANFISIKGPELLSKWVGESESGIRELFRKARQAAPCVIFFDEVDAIAPERGKGGDTQVTERTVSQLLTEMDGIEELTGVVVLAATNRPDMVDPALLRPGRFDLLVEVPPPDPAGLESIYGVHNRSRPTAKGVDWRKLVRLSEGFTGADVAAVSREAAMRAIDRYVAGNGDPEAPDFKIAEKDYAGAIRDFRKMREGK
jgi:transitional endoplasmic reticulum ATPase